jgi:hypothetical protein
MLKTIIFGIIISLIIINPLNNSFSQSYNQTSDDAVVVVADSPEAKTNLDRFDQLDFDAWNNRNWTLF